MRKQSNFRKKYKLPFPLLADTEHKVIDAFGVWGKKKFMGLIFDGIHRITFIIDEEGVVEQVIDKVKTARHAQQLLN
jgi:peroxiredoxin Q/BCP